MDERRKEDYKKYYEIKDLIDSSAFACVYKGIEIGKKDEYRAIKVINLDKIRDSLSFDYENEEDIEKKQNLEKKNSIERAKGSKKINDAKETMDKKIKEYEINLIKNI